MLEKHYAKFHHSQLGSAITIGGRPFTVVGLLEIKEGAQIASSNIYLPLADAQKLLPEEAKGVNIVYLRLSNPSLLSQVKSQIAKEVAGVSVTSSDSFLELMGGVSKISDQYSLLMSLIALAGAIFLIIKTMLGNLVARTSEIGILKAVGWTEKDVQKQLMGEALLQSFIGGLVGPYRRLFHLLRPRVSLHTCIHSVGDKPYARLCQGYRNSRSRGRPAPGERIGRTDRRRTCALPFCGRSGKLFHGQAHIPDEAG